jgi:hypothetical protein
MLSNGDSRDLERCNHNKKTEDVADLIGIQIAVEVQEVGGSGNAGRIIESGCNRRQESILCFVASSQQSLFQLK